MDGPEGPAYQTTANGVFWDRSAPRGSWRRDAMRLGLLTMIGLLAFAPSAMSQDKAMQNPPVKAQTSQQMSAEKSKNLGDEARRDQEARERKWDLKTMETRGASAPGADVARGCLTRHPGRRRDRDMSELACLVSGRAMLQAFDSERLGRPNAYFHVCVTGERGSACLRGR